MSEPTHGNSEQPHKGTSEEGSSEEGSLGTGAGLRADHENVFRQRVSSNSSRITEVEVML